MAGLFASGCLDFAKGAQRAQYDYRGARRQCETSSRDPVSCKNTVAEAFTEAADPATYVPKHERERIDQQQREAQERRDRILPRCDSAADLIRAAFSKRSYARAYTIAEESEGVCPQSSAITTALLAEVRKMSPEEVATCRSDDIARLFWRPVDISDWYAAASGGKLIADCGVYIYGQVTQQFDDKATIEVSSAMRVVVRLDRQRLFQIGEPISFIGRFAEIGRFTTALGASVALPVFDLVYL